MLKIRNNLNTHPTDSNPKNIITDYVENGIKVELKSQFSAKINELFKKIRPKKIIETGTYLGTGTTTIIAKALRRLKIEDALFFTIEVNPRHYQQAKIYFLSNNLKVKALNGLSSPRALLPNRQQIAQKTLLKNGSADIFVDHSEEKRVELYYNETNFSDVPDNLLYECLKMTDFQPDFVLLDSAGHIGDIEFNYLLENLKCTCYIALDDIYHIKHHNSFQKIQSDPRFEVIVASDEKFGFCIAKFTPDQIPLIENKQSQNCDLSAQVKNAKKLLIVRPDSIGDFVIFSGILEHIKQLFQNAEISILLQSHIAPLAQNCPYIDKVIPFERKKIFTDRQYTEQIINRIQQQNSDVAFYPVYSRDKLGDFLTLNSSAKIKIASIGDDTNISLEKKLNNDKFYTHLLPADYKPMLETKRNDELLTGFGILPPKQCTPQLWLTDDDRSAAENILEALKIENPIVICPFGQFDIRNWPIHKWAQLIDSLPDHPILICGTQKNKKQAEQIIELTNHNYLYNLCGKTSLTAFAALLEKSKLCICAESAAAHIAAAVNCPHVVITGGGHFKRFLPYSPLTSMVYLPMTCYNCSWICPYSSLETYCITQVNVDTVNSAVRHAQNTPKHERSAPSLFEQKTNPDRICSEQSQPVEKPQTQNDYLVTAVVSTYNAEKYIAGCLEDLENQTIADRLEIIVVDSGSKQNEKQIVSRFQEKFNNITYLRTGQRETVYKAWNRAIAQARGKYITNANTDDRHTKDALEIMARTLDNNPDIAVVYSDQVWVDDVDGKIVHEYLTPEYSRYRLLSEDCYVSSNPMWRKSIHDEFGFFDGDLFFISGDWEFWLRVSQKYNFLHIDEKLGIRRFSPDCISHAENIAGTDIGHLDAILISKCYHYALQTNTFIDHRGINEHPIFSNWPLTNLLREKLRAKLAGKKMNPDDYIENVTFLCKEPELQLSIVIDTPDLTDALLNNLTALNNQSEKKFEIIVVITSKDKPKIDKRISRLNICFINLKQNLGRSFARNVALKFAKAPYVAFLNQDAIAHRHFVKNICFHFETKDILALRGKVLPLAKNSAFTPDYYDLGDEPVYSLCETETNCAFKKDVLMNVGGFDEDLSAYKCQQLAYKIFLSYGENFDSLFYFPDVIVYHDYLADPSKALEADLDERIGKKIAIRKTLRQKYSLGFESYLEFMQAGYPKNRVNQITDFAKLLNIAVFLQEKNPELALKWAQKALDANPGLAETNYLLGSLYFRLANYDQAETILEKALQLLQPAIIAPPPKNSERELEKYLKSQKCYICCCTKLAACYIKQAEFQKLKNIYTHLLQAPYLQLPDELKSDIQKMLPKLNNVKNIPISKNIKITQPAALDDNQKTSAAAISIPPPAVTKDKQPLISAIVSTYNSQIFLKGCLEDLENQTIADQLEIIVVNSGSEQNEKEIVEQFQQKYNNIKYIETENRETVYAAWNRAIAQARGKYITNANTDDRRRRDALEIMANTFMQNPDIALVYGDQILTHTPNDTFENHHGTQMTKKPDYSPQRLLFGCCVGSQPMWRKSLHDEFGLFDESLTCAGDWDFWLRVSKKYEFKHIPQFLGLYFYNENGVEHSRKIHSLYERYLVGRRYGNPYISVIPLYKHKDNPLVSIIMPAYNAAGHIAFAIESALIQNYRNFELIIVDDGSTDNTKEIIAGFNDDKIKCFYKQNSGPAAARNLGLKKANGSFIVFLDADDMLTIDFIAKPLQHFEKFPQADLVYCDDRLIDENDKTIRIIKRLDFSNRTDLIKNLFSHGYSLVPFRTCIRKSVFDKIGPFDEQLIVAEDYDMLRRFLKYNLNFQHLTEPLYLRRMTDDVLSRNLSVEKARCHLQVIERFAHTFACEQLFPDVTWKKIKPEKRQFCTKYLKALTFLNLGRLHLKAHSPLFADIVLAKACFEINQCLEIAPDNKRLINTMQDCLSARKKRSVTEKQPLCQTA